MLACGARRRVIKQAIYIVSVWLHVFHPTRRHTDTRTCTHNSICPHESTHMQAETMPLSNCGIDTQTVAPTHPHLTPRNRAKYLNDLHAIDRRAVLSSIHDQDQLSKQPVGTPGNLRSVKKTVLASSSKHVGGFIYAHVLLCFMYRYG